MLVSVSSSFKIVSKCVFSTVICYQNEKCVDIKPFRTEKNMHFQYGHLLPKLICPLYRAIPVENRVDFYSWKREKCSFGTVFCYQKRKNVSLVRSFVTKKEENVVSVRSFVTKKAKRVSKIYFLKGDESIKM